jgi:hypothetical protein
MMMTGEPGDPQRLRKANKRLAIAIGVFAVVLYLFMVFVRPLTGS